MSTQVEDLTASQRLEVTQRVRHNVISNLTKNGKIPESQEDRDFLIKMLDGSDRQELTKAKIKSDNQNSKNQAEMANMVTQLLLRTTNRVTGGERESALELVEEVPLVTVEGETSIGTKTFSYDKIMNGE